MYIYIRADHFLDLLLPWRCEYYCDCCMLGVF